MNKTRQLPLLAIVLVTALLAAATVQALTDIGSSTSFPKACSAIAGGWLKSYADSSTGGGGPKVAVIVQVDPANGEAWPIN